MKLRLARITSGAIIDLPSFPVALYAPPRCYTPRCKRHGSTTHTFPEQRLENCLVFAWTSPRGGKTRYSSFPDFTRSLRIWCNAVFFFSLSTNKPAKDGSKCINNRWTNVFQEAGCFSLFFLNEFAGGLESVCGCRGSQLESHESIRFRGNEVGRPTRDFRWIFNFFPPDVPKPGISQLTKAGSVSRVNANCIFN